MPYGILFQEYALQVENPWKMPKVEALRMIWVVASFVITMAYSGNLKVRKAIMLLIVPTMSK